MYSHFWEASKRGTKEGFGESAKDLIDLQLIVG